MLKSNSIFITWIKSYLLVLLVLVGINFSIYMQTQAIIRDEINRTNAVMLKQMQQSIDVGLNDIGNLMYQVSMNEHVRRMMSWSGETMESIRFTPDYMAVTDAQRDLAKFKSVNRAVVELFIYLKNSDTILTTTNLYDTETFYNAGKKKPGVPGKHAI